MKIDSTRVVQILLTHEIENKWNYVFHQYDGLNHKYVNIPWGLLMMEKFKETKVNIDA